MVGIVLFSAGVAGVAYVAGSRSTWQTFVLPLILAGVGFGCTFAPMATIAMHDVGAELSGIASGVLTTARQVGAAIGTAAIGTAAIGAVLQSRLTVALHDEAVKQS